MTPPDPIQPAFDALDVCTRALGDLDAMCCEPGRSPRMAELGATLDAARGELRTVAADAGSGTAAAMETLEDAGAQIGRLQVGCCAPSRLPLYNEILESLMTAQRTLTSVANS